jgi:hypothetical protein
MAEDAPNAGIGRMPSTRFAEARDIASALPDLVDPDEAEAAEIAYRHGYGLSSRGRPIVAAFMEAIKRGRELERGA